MREASYTYINIDDCWSGPRHAQGNIRGNERFPDMKALADYVHVKGLKLGIYSSPGPKTCADYEASYGHEEQDAQTFAHWGIDYLKYDVCSARSLNMFTPEAWPAVYKKMGDALKKTGGPIVYSLSHGDSWRRWSWAPSTGAQLWRTGGDNQPRASEISRIAFKQAGLERFAGPGFWNDPDMLEVGNGKLTADENREHFGLWCLLAAPLIAGNDLTKMTTETLAILTNREAIAIDQDPAGIQGKAVRQEGPISVWVKPLADGSKAVGLVNIGETPNEITVLFRDAGLAEWAELRNIWEGKDLGLFQNTFRATLPTRGMLLLKARSVPAGPPKTRSRSAVESFMQSSHAY